LQQITTLQSDVFAWNTFFIKWRLNRILYDKDFKIIWGKMKLFLNLHASSNNYDMEEEDEEKCELYIIDDEC